METVLLVLLAAVPLLFVPGRVDAFEPHKVGLLLTGVAFLGAIRLGSLFARGVAGGAVAWAREAWSGARRAVRGEPLGAAVLLYVLVAALATAASTRPAISLHGSAERPAGLLVACALVTAFFVSRRLAARPDWLERVAAVATFTAGATSLYALIQLLGHDPIPWAGAATFQGKLRVPGTLGHPNTLGAYLAMTIPLSLHLARSARGSAWKALAAGTALLSLFVLATTLSRGAWLGAAAAAGAFAWASLAARGAGKAAEESKRPAASSPRRRVPLPFLVGAALLVFLLPLATPMGAGFVTRLREVADLRAPTSVSRALLWQAGFRMLADHPILGVGTDAFGKEFPRYRTAAFQRMEWNAATDKAHNELVQVAATQGALGLLAALLVVVLATGACLRLARRGVPGDRALSAVAFASLAAWGVSSVMSFSVAATGLLAAVLAGWVAGRAAESRTEPGAGPEAQAPPSSPPQAPNSVAILTAVAAALVVGALWLALVLPAWRASFVGGRALALPEASRERVALLTEAATLAPWEDRWVAERGRMRLAEAFRAADPAAAWPPLTSARADYERAVAMAPSQPEYRAFLARVLAEEASLRPDVVSPGEAADSLAAALDADPHGANTIELAAQGFLRLGRVPEAHAAAHRSAQLFPDFAVPMLDMGSIAIEEGRYPDAVDTLQLSLGRSWRDVPEMEATARANLAYVYLQLGRNREAGDQAALALLLDPKNAMAARVKADALRAMSGD